MSRFQLLMIIIAMALPTMGRAQEARDSIETAAIDSTIVPATTDSAIVNATDSAIVTAPAKRNIIQKVIAYFDESNKPVVADGKVDFSIIGGPHYSSDAGFGVGLVAAALYRTSPADSLLAPSEAALYADAATKGFYKVGIRGTHIMPRDWMRITYDLNFSSAMTKFWGLGYARERVDGNETRYKELIAEADVAMLVNLGKGLYAGPAAGFNYTHATHVTRPTLWEGEGLAIVAGGAGFNVVYDTRDNLNSPYSGWSIELRQRGYYHTAMVEGTSRKWMGSTELAVNRYQKVWKGGVLAMRAHGRWAYGSVPWTMLSNLGDGAGMRGYYPGRYRDKAEADLTLELRQRVWRRHGITLWIGAGTVAPSPGKFRMRDVLPNGGIGYRWEFKQRTNVRLDLGFGRGEVGFIFNINEAF